MSDGKIYITISDTRGGSGVGLTETPSVSNQQASGLASEGGSNKESAAKIIAKTQFANFVISEAREIVNYSIGNIGNFIGDYEMQQNIQVGLKNLSTAGNIVNAFAQGNLAGGLMALAGVGISKGLEIHAEIIANKKLNREISILRERSGLNSLYDGSRGTEN